MVGRYRYLHLSRFHLPRDRRADDQLPPAQIHADDAGLGPDGAGPGPADIRPCHRRGLQIFLLRGRLAVDTAALRCEGGTEHEDRDIHESFFSMTGGAAPR